MLVCKPENWSHKPLMPTHTHTHTNWSHKPLMPTHTHTHTHTLKHM